MRPEISGKLALALETSSLLAHLVGSRLETTGQSQLARVARGIGNLAFAVSLPFAVKSTLSYIERARQSNTEMINKQAKLAICGLKRIFGYFVAKNSKLLRNY